MESFNEKPREDELTQMEVALLLMDHIKNPCTTPSLPGQSLRASHIRLAKIAIENGKITEQAPLKLLQETIKRYEE